jgi:hypothetical protein
VCPLRSLLDRLHFGGLRLHRLVVVVEWIAAAAEAGSWGGGAVAEGAADEEDRSANGTSASVGRAERIMRSNSRVGGPRAGESGGGSSGSPRCVRILRIGPGSVMKAINQMSPPRWALQGKLLPHPSHQFRPGNPRGVVRAGFVLRTAAAFHGVPAGRGIALLTNVPDGECRHGPPELVIRCEHPVVAMPVLARRWDEIREPVEKLKRRQFDRAVGSRTGGLPPAARADPVGGLVLGST